MSIEIIKMTDRELTDCIEIWNSVVEDGCAFPQTEILNNETGSRFFAEQTHTAAAVDAETGEVVGLYILHPNNVGRCGHICNASYAVKKNKRGLHIGEKLVTDCLEKGREYGFKILQFNAVVCTNTTALNLYKKMGFTRLGVIPKGFLMKSGEYVDIIPHYIEL